MPTVTVQPGATRCWGLAAAVTVGTLAPVVGGIELAIQDVVDKLVTVDRTKVSYTDTGRKEEHDAHRLALIDELKGLKEVQSVIQAEEEASQEDDSYTPWEFHTP